MKNIKFGIGIFISLLFVFLAIHNVDYSQMWLSLMMADYSYLIPSIITLFASYFLRAFRWRYLINPLRRINTNTLFSSIIIGNMANILMPAHLGEILRAYVLAKKRNISTSSILATIIMERIIDVFALLILMVLSIFIYPFPVWVKNSGYLMFIGAFGFFVFLILLKKLPLHSKVILRFLLRIFPVRVQQRSEKVLEKFVSGIVPLKRWEDYIIVFLLSLVIWFCYGLIFYFCLSAFDFNQIYNLPWFTSLILLVVTTIAIVIPSSPGYIGTYHYLCQISLAMFNVSSGAALSFAIVMHGIISLPILALGLIISFYEGINISKLPDKKVVDEKIHELI